MNMVNNIDSLHRNLSNNSFRPSQAPAWFSTLKSLTTLTLENGPLQGQVPPTTFYSTQFRIHQDITLDGESSMHKFNRKHILLSATETICNKLFNQPQVLYRLLQNPKLRKLCNFLSKSTFIYAV
ncbi:unnamed protein product [Coffea canephora]|uniref:Uncharacterized protein n=1 Tax=Coffea canephora TaxID=49390 RepID=A0A068VGW8_COFCA|nr:unnamed protein product [Coffea canephora]